MKNLMLLSFVFAMAGCLETNDAADDVSAESQEVEVELETQFGPIIVICPGNPICDIITDTPLPNPCTGDIRPKPACPPI